MKFIFLSISMLIIAFNALGQSNNNVNVEVNVGDGQKKTNASSKKKRSLSNLLGGKNIEITYTITALEADVDDATFLGLGFNDIETDFYLICKTRNHGRVFEDYTLVSSYESPEIKKNNSASMKFTLSVSDVEICEHKGGAVLFYVDSSDISNSQIMLTEELVDELQMKGAAKRSSLAIHSDLNFLFWDIKTNNVRVTYDMELEK